MNVFTMTWFKDAPTCSIFLNQRGHILYSVCDNVTGNNPGGTLGQNSHPRG